MSSVFVWQFLILYALLALAGANFTSYGGREKFENIFEETCGKYPFVQRFADIMNRPLNPATDQYVVYAYSEKGLGGNGGLGDRLGGLITAIAYAIRSERRLLISGDKAFEDTFRPYVRSKEGVMMNGNDVDEKYNWGKWDWAGFDREFSKCLSVSVSVLFVSFSSIILRLVVLLSRLVNLEFTNKLNPIC